MARRAKMPDGSVIKSSGDGPMFTLQVANPKGEVKMTLKLSEVDALPIYQELGRFLGL